MAIVIFDNSVAGHHLSYLHGVVDGVDANEEIIICLPLEAEAMSVKENFKKNKNIIFKYFSLEKRKKDNFLNRIINDFNYWFVCKKTLKKIAMQKNIKKVFLPYFDPFLKPFIFLGSPFGELDLSFIYMRPPVSFYENNKILHRIIFYAIFFRLILVKSVNRIYILDPRLDTGYCINNIFHDFMSKKIKFIKDPGDFILNNKIKLPVMHEDKLVLLVFGAISKRKGVFELLDAYEQNKNYLNNWVIIVAGRQENDFREQIKKGRWSSVVDNGVFLLDGFLSDDDLKKLILRSDAVWGAYSQHIHMSGVIVKAGMAKKAVICSLSGVIGWYAKYKNIGPVVDGSISAIKDSLLVLNDSLVRENFGNCGYSVFSENTWKDFSDKLSENFYE